jgi:hypothetical protein
MAAVDTYQFRYSSNQTVLWDVVDRSGLTSEQATGWEKAKSFYRPLDAADTFVLPGRRGGFVELPVSLPDDEILIDRMYFKNPGILKDAWGAIFEQTHQRGELFTIQLHPERVAFFEEPLGDLLSMCRGRKRGVWLAPLEDIAEWWSMKSGNSAEFMREDGAYKVVVKACEGSKVYLREYGNDRFVETAVARIDGERRPCVGVSPGSDRAAMELLKDKGYILEVSEDTDTYVIHLGKIESADYPSLRPHLDSLEACEGPLLRFGVWPHGNWSAVAVTGDIDALTIWDFIHRLRGA